MVPCQLVSKQRVSSALRRLVLCWIATKNSIRVPSSRRARQNRREMSRACDARYGGRDLPLHASNNCLHHRSLWPVCLTISERISRITIPCKSCQERQMFTAQQRPEQLVQPSFPMTLT